MYKSTIDEAIKACDISPAVKQDIRRAIGFLKNASSVLGIEPEVVSIAGEINNIIAKLERM